MDKENNQKLLRKQKTLFLITIFSGSAGLLTALLSYIYLFFFGGPKFEFSDLYYFGPLVFFIVIFIIFTIKYNKASDMISRRSSKN